MLLGHGASVHRYRQTLRIRTQGDKISWKEDTSESCDVRWGRTMAAARNSNALFQRGLCKIGRLWTQQNKSFPFWRSIGCVLKTFLSEELGHKKTQLGFIVGKAGVTRGWGSLSDSQEPWWCWHNGSSWLSACLDLELSQRLISACVYEGASWEVQLRWEMGAWSEGKEKTHTEPQHSHVNHLAFPSMVDDLKSWTEINLPSLKLHWPGTLS